FSLFPSLFYLSKNRQWQKSFGREASHLKKKDEERQKAQPSPSPSFSSSRDSFNPRPQKRPFERDQRDDGASKRFKAERWEPPAKSGFSGRSGFEGKPAFGGKPAFAGKPAFGGKPSFGGNAGKPEPEEKLHPSWEAKRKEKELQKSININSFSGNKIV